VGPKFWWGLFLANFQYDFQYDFQSISAGRNFGIDMFFNQFSVCFLMIFGMFLIDFRWGGSTKMLELRVCAAAGRAYV